MYSIFKYLLYAYLLSSYKSLPLAYYVRFYWQAFKNLILPIYLPSFLDKNSSPFQTKTIHTYNSPFECDIYLHKSNSTYFEELDISRTKLMTLIFQKFFIQYKTESGTWAYVPVANVFTSFKKEIKPYQKYDVKSRILGWDSKWIFILSKFESGQGLHAVSITKYVLKDKRKTIAPVKALEFCGYDVDKYSEKSRKGAEMVDWFIETGDVEKLEI